MNKFTEFVASCRERSRRERDNHIDESFEIVEREGQLWLTCCGVAFMTFPADMTHSDVVRVLELSRNCAKAYDRHSPITLTGDAEDMAAGQIIVTDRREINK